MRQMRVLLVEDNPHDVRLIKRALGKADFPHDLRVVDDGDNALAYLVETRAHAEASSAPRPDLILLDLNSTPNEWSRRAPCV